ncbi:MAG: VpsF family polysaccharide biosynthesis protein [Hyphomicrobiaceae bacterium]
MSTRTPIERPSVPDGPPFGLLLGVLTIVLLTISPLALVHFGFNYDEPGGNPLEKIHPATLIAAAIVLLAGIAAGNPLSWFIEQAGRHPLLIIYLGAIALLILHSIRVVNLPFTQFFDTFLLPALVFLLFHDVSDRRARHLGWIIHALMIVNALIGIGEFAGAMRLTPIVASGVVIEDDWRSTALLGHPLANASLTGSYLLLLALGAGRDLPWLLRAAAFVSNAAGMIVFGGRAASVLLVALLGLLLLLRLVAIMRGAPFDKATVLKVLVLAPVAALVVTVLAENGFFDQFMERFIDDKGSADTRTEMFELFRFLSWHELLLAPDAKLMETLRFRFGLDFGIESFWISFILSYGLVASIVFFAALLAFSYDIARHVRRGAVWAFLFFYLVATTSVSLSAKSPLLAIFVLMLLVLFHRPAAESNKLGPPGRQAIPPTHPDPVGPRGATRPPRLKTAA